MATLVPAARGWARTARCVLAGVVAAPPAVWIRRDGGAGGGVGVGLSLGESVWGELRSEAATLVPAARGWACTARCAGGSGRRAAGGIETAAPAEVSASGLALGESVWGDGAEDRTPERKARRLGIAKTRKDATGEPDGHDVGRRAVVLVSSGAVICGQRAIACRDWPPGMRDCAEMATFAQQTEVGSMPRSATMPLTRQLDVCEPPSAVLNVSVQTPPATVPWPAS